MSTVTDTQTRHDQHGRYPEATSVDDFRHNLAAVDARIKAACARVGRDAATTLVWLALRNSTAKWSRSAHDWKTAMNPFAILFAERFVQRVN